MRLMRGVPVRKRFGQHFLEPAWIDKVVAAVDPRPDETFIEIGPGHGALTVPLAARAKAVVAFEIDRDLAARLRHASPANVTIVQGDFLVTGSEYLALHHQSSPALEPLPAALRVAGNLPYNAASPILFKLVELYLSGAPLRDAAVMLQREVADRLMARPGTHEYGALSVLIQRTASVERLLNLPPGAFRPPPKVRSSLVRLRFHPPEPPVRDDRLFAAFVRGLFSHRRKTLSNALRAYDPARRLQLRGWLDGRRRPETLTIAEFVRLAEALPNLVK